MVILHLKVLSLFPLIHIESLENLLFIHIQMALYLDLLCLLSIFQIGVLSIWPLLGNTLCHNLTMDSEWMLDHKVGFLCEKGRMNLVDSISCKE